MSATVTETAKLPGPHDRPGSDLVIYDGNCSFCTAQVRRLARWDARARLSFVSLHDPYVAQHFPDLSHESLMKEMVLVDHRGGRHRGAAAFRYLTRKLPRLWPLLPVLHLPGTLPLWQWCYRQVAQRRYRLAAGTPCDGDACKIHFPGD